MNTRSLRVKNSKKGVTPVIATIILIAGTLVLALVVGAYTFGLFGSNVKTVTLSSATLYGGTELATSGTPGTSYITFSLNNPGSASSISGITLTGSAIVSVVNWQYIPTGSSSGTGVNFAAVGLGTPNALTGGQVTPYTFYPYGTAQSIVTGQVYNYVINFANGQSVSGSLIAQ
jgi:flagellin-like protein